MFPLRMFRSPMVRPPTISPPALALLLALAWAGPALGQDSDAEAKVKPAASSLTLASVDVTPEEPTAETLCQLSVTLQNSSDQPISGLRFAVSVNGHSLPVYDKQVFLDVVPPGGEVAVPLYNFWVTETHRPLPAKGPLTVEVRVTDARWTKREMEPLEPAKPGDSGEPKNLVETWTLLESLDALPEAVTATRKLRR